MVKDKKRSVLASKLSGKGIRLTRQRRIIIDLIENAKEHLHASDVLRLAQERDERIDRATVYRTLALLKVESLIDELDLLHLDGAEHHYELKRQATHVHIGCRGCGRILEYSSELMGRLETEISEKTGFEVESARAEVAGLCPECRRK